MDLKVARLPRMDPPTNAELTRSGGAEIRILVWEGDLDRTSYSIRSPNPGRRVDPPARTTCEKSVDRRSISDFMMESTKISATPASSDPIKDGSNKMLGAW